MAYHQNKRFNYYHLRFEFLTNMIETIRIISMIKLK